MHGSLVGPEIRLGHCSQSKWLRIIGSGKKKNANDQNAHHNYYFNRFAYFYSLISFIVLLLQLQHLGKEYPGGADKFRTKCHDVFVRNSSETDKAKIEEMIKRGEFVVKELEALYSLRKYRAMKKRYYDWIGLKFIIIHYSTTLLLTTTTIATKEKYVWMAGLCVMWMQ